MRIIIAIAEKTVTVSAMGSGYWGIMQKVRGKKTHYLNPISEETKDGEESKRQDDEERQGMELEQASKKLSKKKEDAVNEECTQKDSSAEIDMPLRGQGDEHDNMKDAKMTPQWACDFLSIEHYTDLMLN